MYADIETSQLTRAHNDWLEMIFELGWPGALLWFSALTALVLRCFLGVFRRERDRLYPLVGCCAGLLVGLHSFVDFSLQIPAVAATFAALLGIGVAQSYSSQEEG
jgi:O-antigen ligase